MLPSATERILATLAEDARVLDVGGWAAPFNRATHMLDVMPYATRGAMGSYGPPPERFGADTWIVRDICDREPWPYADDFFDFALCVTTLEDVRDPVGVCRELSRVARAGYVEVPTVEAELMFNVMGNGPWLGHQHHRWFCDREGDGLVFWHKDPAVHFDWRVRVLPRWQAAMSLEDQLLGVFWEGTLPAREDMRFLAADREAMFAALEARVRARFAPSPRELALKRLRERARDAGGRAKAPGRRLAERALGRR